MIYLLAVGVLVLFPGKASGEMLLFGASLTAAGLLFYRAESGKTLLYAAVTVELLQICFGVSNSLSYLLFPVFYRWHPQTAGNGMMLLALVSRYISVYLYGDTIHMQPDGSLLHQPGFSLLALQLLGIASLFCILYSDKKAAESFRLRYEKTSAFRHDIRNHMSVIRGLLHREKYGQALSYLEELEKDRAQEEIILLEVENSYNGEAGITEGRGLSNIRAVAEKYQGKLHLEVREGSFCLSVLLVIPQQPEDIPQQKTGFGVVSLQFNSSYATPRTDYAQAGQERARGKEKCTTDTDQVDREIKQLREKKKQLEQQLERAAGDEKKCRELEKQLAQINAELAHKDNDTYRRQHAHTSM